MTHSPCKRQTLASTLSPSHYTVLLPVCGKDGSIIPHFALYFSHWSIPHPAIDSMLGVQGTYSQQLALCVFPRSFPCSVYAFPEL